MHLEERFAAAETRLRAAEDQLEIIRLLNNATGPGKDLAAEKLDQTSEDVANMALFLVSDEARTITGQSINVDAGGVMVV